MSSRNGFLANTDRYDSYDRDSVSGQVCPIRIRNPGDYRYRPSGYQIGNVTGTLQSPYSVSMAINATGEYTLKVTYNKDVYDGNSWVSDGTADTKTVTFKVITKAAGVQTGDE